MSSLTPKTSSLVPRIPPHLTRALPWSALFDLFELENGISQLETALQLQRGTLSKAQREYPSNWQGETPRGLSAKVHQLLLEGIAEKLSTGEKLRAWLTKYWPVELLDQMAGFLTALSEALDLAQQIPQVGAFPTDYLERAEKPELLDLLLNNKQAQVLWITGPGGSGKSTLALSLLRLDWEQLKKHYEKVFWVDVETSSYTEGLRQMAESLDLAGQAPGVIEHKLKNLTRKSKVLFILDALYEVAGLAEWQQLAGYLGKLVVTSRTRLSESELRSDGRLHQVRLEGFSQAEGRQFLQNADPSNDRLIQKTEGLPLALRILNGQKSELGLSTDELLTRLERSALETLEYPPGLDRREASLRTCFDLTWQTLLERQPEAARYFQAAGIFRSRTIFKPILEQTANTDPISGDRLAAILLRYNLLNLLTIRGQRFVQLHPLLQAYAREKLAASNSREQVQAEYLKAFSQQMQVAWQTLATGEYPATVHWLAQDVMAVLNELLARAEWLNAVRLLSDSFDLLLQEGYADKIEAILRTLEVQIRDDSPTANLFRMALANQAGKLALVIPDIPAAQARFKLAHEIGQCLAEHFVNEPDYLREMSRTLLGLATCLLDSQQAQAGLDLIHSKLADYIFGGLGESFLTDRNLLSGQLMAELGKPAQALEYFQAVYDSRQASGLTIQAQAALALQADCYRQLGETDQALEIYTHLYKEMPHPIGLRVELGLSLAGCLAENRNFSQALSVLDELEGWLADYAGWEAFKAHFARLWKYRALADQELGEKETALACARRSLEFWGKIPESAPEQAQMRALIDQLKTE